MYNFFLGLDEHLLLSMIYHTYTLFLDLSRILIKRRRAYQTCLPNVPHRDGYPLPKIRFILSE